MADTTPLFPVLPITSSSTLAKCKALAPLQGDVFICSYPKSGTTWTQNIIATLLNKGPEIGHVSNYAPFFEIDPHWNAEGTYIGTSGFRDTVARVGRRTFNTHLHWEMLPKSPGARYIYLVRDGRDVVVSFYHHLSNQTGDAGGFDGSFEEFFAQWNSGMLPYGHWANHLKSYDACKGDPRVLFLRYADMKTDLKGCVQQIVKHCDIQISEEQVNSLLPCFSIDYMKKNLSNYQPISVEWKNDFKFVRKGEVGDHASLVTDKMQAEFNSSVNEVFPTGLPEWV